MLASEDERWPNLERIAVASARADQDAVASHPFDDFLRSPRVRLGRVWLDDLHTDRHADRTDLADRRVRAEVLEPPGEVTPDLRRALHDALVVNHLEHGQRRGHGDGVATESAEELACGREALSEVAPRDDGRNRMAVAHWLAERHDVRDDA